MDLLAENQSLFDHQSFFDDGDNGDPTLRPDLRCRRDFPIHGNTGDMDVTALQRCRNKFFVRLGLRMNADPSRNHVALFQRGGFAHDRQYIIIVLHGTFRSGPCQRAALDIVPTCDNSPDFVNTGLVNAYFTVKRKTPTDVQRAWQMRNIEIIDDVRLRFPGRDAEFDLGVEVGAVSVLMTQGAPLIQRELSMAAVEQLRPIAERFRYALVATASGDETMSVSLVHWSRRPLLRVV